MPARSRIPTTSALGWILALLVASCGTPPERDSVVAQVGDAVLTEADLAAQVSSGLEGPQAEVERERFVENWLREELLYQEALAQELDQKAVIQGLLEETRRSLLVASLLDAEFNDRDVQIPETAVQQYYDQHRDEFLLLQPEVRARHILVATLRDANARRQNLLQGESFEDVALEYSRDQDSRTDGGDLGYFSEEDDPILWKECQQLSLNRISKPRRTESGYHLIQVLDRKEAGAPRELAEVRAQIVETLVHQEHRSRLDELIERLKSGAEWTVRAPKPPAQP